MPFVVTAIFMYTMYSVKPQEIVSSFLLSGMVLFFVMVWIGMTAAQNERPVEEQILILKMDNSLQYYLGKFLLLLALALLMDIIYTFFPVIQNAINGFELFSQKLGTYEIANVFILQLGTALLGCAVGNFLHPRIMKDRKLAIILTVFIAVIAVTVPALKQECSALRWVLWIFPPVMLPSEIYGEANVFRFSQTLLIFLILLFYVAVYATVKGFLCNRKRW